MGDPTSTNGGAKNHGPSAGARVPRPFDFEWLAEYSDDAIIVSSSSFDDDGRIVDFVYEYVNAAAVETIGLPAEQLLGRGLLEILPAHAELGLFDQYRRVAETGTPLELEIPWFEDGNVAGAFEARVTAVPGGIMSVARNVTARLLAEHRLATTEQRLDMLVQHGAEAVLHIVDGMIEWATPAVDEILGVSSAVVRGTRAAAWCHPRNTHLLDRAVEGNAEPTRGRVRSSGNSWQTVEVVTHRNLHGEGIVAVLRTVEPELESEPSPPDADDGNVTLEQLVEVFDRLPDSVMIVNRGTIHFGNAAAAALCGVESADDLSGRPFSDFMTPDDVAAALEHGQRFRDGLAGDEPHATRLLSLDGSLRQIEVTIAFTTGEDDSLLISIRNVTERGELLRDLELSEATGRFLTENSTDVLLRVDKDRRISFASAASVAILGTSPSELVGRELSDLFAERDRSKIDALVDTARSAGGAPQIEAPLPPRGANDPMWVEVEVRCIGLDEADPQAYEYHVTMYDIRRERSDREALKASERWLRTLVDGAPVGIFELDTHGNCNFVNQRYCEILGIDGLDDIAGREWLRLLHAEDRQRAYERFPDPAARLDPFDIDVRFVRNDGTAIHTVVGIAPMIDDDGEASGWLGTVDDVSEQVQLEEARREAAELFEAAFEHAPLGVALMTVNEFPPRLIRANSAMLRLCELTTAELLDFDFYAASHPDDVAPAAEGRAALLAGEIDTHSMEIRQRFSEEGEYRWFSLVRSVVRNDDGEPTHLIAQSDDISERKRTQELHYHLAVTDSLTGLSNRRHFEDRLANTHARLLRSEERIGVIFVDLDKFKVVNDELGHRAGDELLQTAAHLIGSTIRPGDTAARLGGDEFAILAEHQEEEELVALARRLQERLDLRQQLGDGSTHHVTVSIGIASRRSSEVTPIELVKLADAAMYRAKRDGRNRFRLAERI